MIRLRDTLQPENVQLAIDARSREEAIHQVAELLRSDTRVKDWKEFYRGLKGGDAGGKTDLGSGLALPHVRTAAVNDLVMAFGRLVAPVEGGHGPIRFVMVIGIPKAMDAEYLRLVGILMRVFRSDELRTQLEQAKKPAQVVDVFEQGETEL
jgi:mannitol/fructose-specific phosphotransferase system IIA component (Ntr-type)